MSTYELRLAIHILAAVAWVGGGLAIHIFGRMAEKTGDPQRMLEFSQQASFIGPRLYGPLSLILLIAGILLVGETPYDHTDTWVMIGYAGWVISFLTGVGYYMRADRKQQAIVAGGGLGSAEFLALYKQVATVSLIELVILFAVVADMAIKPGS